MYVYDTFPVNPTGGVQLEQLCDNDSCAVNVTASLGDNTATLNLHVSHLYVLQSKLLYNLNFNLFTIQTTHSLS